MSNNDEVILNIIIPSKTFDVSLCNCINSVQKAIGYYYRYNKVEQKIEICVILKVDDIYKAKEYYRGQKDINFFSQGFILMGESHARNVGISNSRSKFIAFVDHDCTVKEDWVSQILFSFGEISSDSKIICVMGNHWLYQKYSIWLKLYGKYREDHAVEHFIKENGLTFTTRLDGRNFAMLSAAAKNFHFREDVIAEQDREYGMQIINNGYKILFNEAMIVYHEPIKFNQIIKRKYIYGRGSSRWRKTPSWFYRFYFLYLTRFLRGEINLSQMLFTMFCNFLFQLGRISGNIEIWKTKSKLK